MNKLKSLFLTLCVGFGIQAHAQDQTGPMTLQQAIDYGLKNNPALKNANVDVEIARKKVKETAAIGLPHINGSIDYTGQPQIAAMVIPSFTDPNKTQEFRMGISHTGAAKIQATWLILDGSYLLGLKASKEYVELASRMRASSEIDTRVNISKAYYMALIGDQSVTLLDSTIKMLQQSHNDVKALFEAGFAERIDVQRLSLQLNNLKIQREQTHNQREFAYRLLKFQMGMDVNAPLLLSDELYQLKDLAGKLDTAAKPNLESRPDYSLLTQTQVLNKMNETRYKMGYLPSLSGFGSHQQTTYAMEGNFGDLGSKYYGGTTWGLSLRIPIFNGFQQNALLQQAQLASLKTHNDLRMLESAVENDVFYARTHYVTAKKTVENQNENYELAKEIREIAAAKYQEGVGSSLEVTTSNNDLLVAETNYLSAIYDLLVAEIEYNKALGRISK